MFDTWLKRIVLVMAGVLLAAVFTVVIVAALTPLKSKSSDIFKKVGDECSKSIDSSDIFKKVGDEIDRRQRN